MKFKVGDKVWFNQNREYVKVVGTPPYKNTIICRLNDNENYIIDINDLHETAQSMFEALGYEEDYIPYYCGHKENKTKLLLSKIPYEDDRKEIIMFNLCGKDYQTYGISGTALLITPQLHLAIHQQLIELGWV